LLCRLLAFHSSPKLDIRCACAGLFTIGQFDIEQSVDFYPRRLGRINSGVRAVASAHFGGGRTAIGSM
jgi:hypothetical protein